MRAMWKRKWPVVLALLALLLAACEPSINITNNTDMEVKVLVLAAGFDRQLISVAPRDNNYANVGLGVFIGVAIPSQTWRDQLLPERDRLRALLNEPEKLGPDGVRQVTDQLLELQKKLDEIEKTANEGASCTAKYTSNSIAANIVVDLQGDRLVISCSAPEAE